MSSAKTKNLTPIYAFIQGLYWMNFAAIMGYSGFYLLGSGFSNTEIGIIIAIAGILSAVLQPVLASYADRPESPSLKKFLQLLLVLQLILGIALLFCKSILLTGVVYGCGVTLLQLLTPFINSLGMESINQGQTLNFGIARGMGSVAYAALSYVLGIITSRTGITAVPVVVFDMSICIECNPDIRMSHQVLQCFWIHAGTRLIATVGVSTYMRRDLWKLRFINTVIFFDSVLKILLPVQCHQRHFVFIQKQESPVAIDNRLNLVFFTLLQNNFEAFINFRRHRDLPGSGISLGAFYSVFHIRPSHKLMVNINFAFLHIWI